MFGHRGIFVAFALVAAPAFAQSKEGSCIPDDGSVAGMEFHLQDIGDNCLGVTGGFSDDAGSFAKLAVATRDRLGMGETIEADALYGVRLRRVQLGLTKPLFRARRLEAGFTVYGQRFQYDQSRDASILAFSRDIQEFDSFGADNLLKYFSRSYGATASLQFALRKFSKVRVAYSYDVTGVTPLTSATGGFFNRGTNPLSDIRTSSVTLSYVHSTVTAAANPTHGMKVSTSVAIAGLGGDVNTVRPSVEVKWFHPGLWNQAIGLRLHASMLTGYGGKAAPPFDRDYTGGEDEIRGFSSWAVSPIVSFPGAADVPVFNADGSQRMQKSFDSNGVVTYVPSTMTIPVYRPVSVGGDTKVVASAEYRIPLVRFLTLALFVDAGVDRVSFPSQLQVRPQVLANLDWMFPDAGFTNTLPIQPGSQKIRMSSGVELQARLPKTHTPVRLYWAYNPLRYEGGTGVKQPFDRTFFPNAATFLNAVALFPAGTPVPEPRSMLRVAIGFSF